MEHGSHWVPIIAMAVVVLMAIWIVSNLLKSLGLILVWLPWPLAIGWLPFLLVMGLIIFAITYKPEENHE